MQLIRNSENLGFAGGMNVGILIARSAGADAIWLLNNDTQLAPNAIAAMASYLSKHPDIACIGSVILNSDETEISTIGGYTYRPWLSHAKAIGRGMAPQRATAEATQSFDYVCGSAIMLAPAYFKKLEAIPNRSFLYFEELHLSRALDEHGLKTGVCTQALVTHKQGVSTRKLGEQQRSYFVTLSALIYTYQYHPLFVPTVVMARVVRAIHVSLATREPGTLRGCFVAIFHFLRRCSAHRTLEAGS